MQAGIGARLAERSPARVAEQVVAAVTGVSLEAFRQRSRGRAATASSRQLLLYLLHVEEGMTLSAAAALLGRDRTTAGHACRVVEDRRDEPGFDRRVGDITNALERVRQADRVAGWVR
jgi:chromosomal replication initiation ATPase DnaA